jgi:hypothetical protein
MLAVALTACHDATGPTFEQVSARLRWEQHGPASYQLTITRSCFCTAEMTGPVLIVVADGEVQSRTYVRTGESVQPTYADLFPTVDGLFEYIESVRESGTPVDARYDAALGYPVHITAGDHPELDGMVTTEVTLDPRRQ